MGYLRVQTIHQIICEVARISDGLIQKPRATPYTTCYNDIDIALSLWSDCVSTPAVKALVSVQCLLRDIRSSDLEFCTEERGQSLLRVLNGIETVKV